MPSPEFTVLFVCTGNVCRSPMAEHLFARGLTERLGDAAKRFAVGSAGTGALAGEPMTAHAASVLIEYDVVAATSDAFRGRQLEAAYIADADLILAATRDHRAQIATLAPTAVQRTFTITEFALLTAEVNPSALPEGDPVARARALTEQALALRGIVRPEKPQELDVADPYTLSLDVFRDVAGQLHRALTVILDAIAGKHAA